MVAIKKSWQKITSWSFSRFSTYRQCPLRAKLLYIEKRKEPPSPAMDRGNVIHGEAAEFLTGKIKTLPKSLVAVASTVKDVLKQSKLKTVTADIEQMWGFDFDWNPVPWNDWNGCKLRVKMDAALYNWKAGTLKIFDWKTGKFSPQWNVQEYVEQLELYAVSGLHKYKTDADLTVTPKLVYTDQGIEYPDNLSFDQPDREKLRKEWDKKIKPMLADEKFAAKPNDKCKWCSFSKSAGGPCKF